MADKDEKQAKRPEKSQRPPNAEQVAKAGKDDKKVRCAKRSGVEIDG